MSYIDNKLLPDEKILYRTKKHYIIFHVPMILLLLALLLCTGNHITDTIHAAIHAVLRGDHIETYVQRIPLLIITVILAYSWLKQWIIYQTSEYVVTNKRIVMKEGFFDRYLVDTRLATIANVSIDQSLLGRALNYGTIAINSFGGTNEYFTLIADPNEFQKQVLAQLDKVVRGPSS